MSRDFTSAAWAAEKGYRRALCHGKEAPSHLTDTHAGARRWTHNTDLCSWPHNSCSHVP